MAFERIELNICPAGDMPVFHCSQYDTGRPIIIDLLNGDDAFTPSAGTTFELHCRKVDDNIVTLDTYEVDGNTLTFTSTEQLCACPGDNLCEVAIYLDELCMGTLNFMLHVEPDPLAGGLESETQIYNLTEQVEEITEQVIGDNYYDKTEVDDLLDTKADAATTYTKTEVDTALNLKADRSTTYTKTETNNLLAGKADASDTYSKAQVDSKLSLKADKATTYTKTETDTLLGYKANASQVYTMSQTDLLLNEKADKSTTYTKTQVDDALSLKANSADLATVATTGDYDDLLNKPTIPAAQVQSDYAQSDNTQVDYIKNKPDIEGMINNAILDIMPVDTATGAIATFNTELAAPLVNVSSNIVATGGNGTPDNPNPINGYSEVNICNTQNESIVDLFSIDSDFRGTVVFNQLVQNGNFESTSGWYANRGTISISNNKCTYTATANVTNSSSVYTDLPVAISHKFFVACFITLSKVTTVKPRVCGTEGTLTTLSANTRTEINNIISANGLDNKIYIYVNATSSMSEGDTAIIENVMTIDLTAMFGSTIADYIYGLEQATPGAGVAFFRSIYPADYYDYDVGTNELVGKIIPNATIAFGQTVYGGVLDVTRGKLKPCIEYPSYNGETLSGRWLSSEATYVEGTTPPTGSQVVSLDDYGSDIDLTPVQIRALVGENNVYSDTNGNTTVQFKDSIQHYIDTKVGS